MRAIITAVLLAVALPCSAWTGYLVRSESIVTISGLLAWSCTYEVGGTFQTVILRDWCPMSMEFE